MRNLPRGRLWYGENRMLWPTDAQGMSGHLEINFTPKYLQVSALSDRAAPSMDHRGNGRAP